MDDLKPKFQDGERVLLENDVLVTIKEWSYIPSRRMYTYIIEENPGTFFFERELRKFSGKTLNNLIKKLFSGR